MSRETQLRVTIKSILTTQDVSKADMLQIFARTGEIKEKLRRGIRESILENKVVAMVFERPSLRTRASFEAGVAQMGGHTMYLKAYPKESADIIIGEDVRDIASVLSGYADAIVARAYRHRTLEDLAQFASVLVINAMTDQAHPVQIISDMYTIFEKKGKMAGLNLSYYGDGRGNTAQDMAMACAKLGINFTLSCPKYEELQGELPDGLGYPGSTYWEWAKNEARVTGARLSIEHDPTAAARNADVIYTDSWIAFDVPEEKARQEDIKRFFLPYQVNRDLIGKAKPDVMVMHCLPAYKGNEIAADVFDDPHCSIYPQAANRMHVQKGILASLL